MPSVIQTSFNAGELSPTMFGRVDIGKYHVGAARMMNFFVDYRGGATSRPGSEFVTRAKFSDKYTRVVDFQFNEDQTYCLEFGDRYMRVHQNGAPVLEPQIAITSISNANPCVVTAPGHNVITGDWIYFESIAGMTELNTQTFVATVIDANNISLQLFSGVNFNTTSFNAYVSGGFVSPVYELETPYSAIDIELLRFVQSADVVTITNKKYQPRTLTRTQHYSWTLAVIDFDSTISPPTGVALATTGPGTANYGYCVTAVSVNDGSESVASEIATTASVNIATTSGTITVSWAPVTDADYYYIYKSPIAISSDVPIGASFGYVGTSYGLEFKDANITADYTKTPPMHRSPFAILPVQAIIISAPGASYVAADTAVVVDPTGTGARIQPVIIGGEIQSFIILDGGKGYTAPTILVTTSTGSGFAGTVNVGRSEGTYPAVSAYFQQRRVFASSINQPQTLWLTKPGAFNNMDVSNPVVGDDGLTLTLTSNQVNEIRNMLSMPGGLVVLTSGGAWQVSGGDAKAAITPQTANAQSQSYNGCSDLQAIAINYEILYVQARGSTVRNLSYNFFANIYTGADLSVLSNHLFTGYDLVSWCWAEEPFKKIHAVRNDGKILYLTFLKDQEVSGWSVAATRGFYRSVTSLREVRNRTAMDSVYTVVDRKVNGEWVKYIERFASRLIRYGMAEEAWCLDCALELPMEKPALNLTLSGSNGIVELEVDASYFTAGNIGDVVRAGGGIIDITSVESVTHATGTVREVVRTVVPFLEQPAPFEAGSWTITTPVLAVGGLGHLEGEAVGILADGSVLPERVVINGQVALDFPATKIVIGLPYTCELQTLPLDVGDPTTQGKRKKVAALTALVDHARGLQVGSTFDSLFEVKEWSPSIVAGTAIPLLSGQFRQIIDGGWAVEGQICFRQSYPLPATILAVVPELIVGDNIR